MIKGRSALDVMLKKEAALPTKSAHHHLYRHFDAKKNLLYVGISLNAVARLAQHRDKASWFDDIASITIESFGSREVLEVAEREAIVSENPLHNIVRYENRIVLPVMTWWEKLQREEDSSGPATTMDELIANTAALWHAYRGNA